ncbi:hypothetical protein HMPREF3208_00953 [Gardnerella vaginalis]|uniref:Uncharacterized protein n=1 Tax=Gardnerella vaginalis TaxID=2702 RepID=A0A133NUA0_GARVA|nr:hypothetical protein HMPREF3208_00953 [Gardnerella vaginalis]
MHVLLVACISANSVLAFVNQNESTFITLAQSQCTYSQNLH